MRESLRRQLAGLSRRGHRQLLLAAVTGALTGLAVAGFDWVVAQHMLDKLYELPVAVQVCAPLVGLTLAAISLRWVARGASPATSDEYIHNFHEPSRRLDLQPVAGRVLAAAATLGMGGAMGFEGPSMYMGAAIGTALQTRFRRWFDAVDMKVLMVAGAAAGVAAIFKTPATGAIFAIEVPFQDDTAKRMLFPALIASATGYLVFVAFNGTTPLFPISGSPPFGLRELAGAAVLGLLAGAGARGFALLVKRAKRWQQRLHPVVSVVLGGGTLAASVIVSRVVYGETLTIGSGYQVITLDRAGRPRALGGGAAARAARHRHAGDRRRRWRRRACSSRSSCSELSWVSCAARPCTSPPTPCSRSSVWPPSSGRGIERRWRRWCSSPSRPVVLASSCLA